MNRIALITYLLASFAALNLARADAQDASTTTNRLADESSPYLLQHAHNPVDWYPWGEEALARAKREHKMIFLSVGYAACHWCHVMEAESFVDPEIARVLNDNFVCIKVDREERPDVDQIYMLAIQLISGQGGWPMSVFLTPDAEPFWGGTYFPARTGDRGQATGFLQILKQMDLAWKNQSDGIRDQAARLTAAIKQQQESQQPNDGEVSPAIVGISDAERASVFEALTEEFDPDFGGFRYSVADANLPKFPEASKLEFLIHQAERQSVSEDDRRRAQAMLTATLDAMVSGAMYDALGGGFHRYAVDRRWQIPHFEKMLYDNGQLASVYSRAYQLTGNQEYRWICETICEFVIRELTASTNRADGSRAFYSSLDADSEGEEGAFYRWTDEQLTTAAKRINGFELFADVYALRGEPNFESEYYVPAPSRPLAEIANDRGIAFSELIERLAEPRKQLWLTRQQREHPRTDTKILTAWNGLMIRGLADAGRFLERPDFIDAAASAANFLLHEMPDSQGRLRRTYGGGKASLNAYLDDYAFLVSGLIGLHKATGDARWLEKAEALTRIQIEHFWDAQAGGFYFTSDDHSALLVRLKDPLDGAIPSGIGVTAENLAYLAESTDDDFYQVKWQQTVDSVRDLFDRAPSGMTRLAATGS